MIAYAVIVCSGGQTVAHMANVTIVSERQSIHTIKRTLTNRRGKGGQIGAQIKRFGVVAVYAILNISVNTTPTMKGQPFNPACFPMSRYSKTAISNAALLTASVVQNVTSVLKNTHKPSRAANPGRKDGAI